ncbi:hypothetical protein PQR63_21710 [Herbaspirillum rhizosphaerae]|uniref:Uncharacterized protein n=1 Tax=Herbaspirillum rhizosphaerae TaxID=346179 RepID=A0ABW8ZDF9_9BURK
MTIKKETLGLILAACLWAVYLLADAKRNADAQQCTEANLPGYVRDLWPSEMSVTGVAAWRRKGGKTSFDGHAWSPSGGEDAMRLLTQRLTQRHWTYTQSSTQIVFNNETTSLAVDSPCPSCGNIHFRLSRPSLLPVCQ